MTMHCCACLHAATFVWLHCVRMCELHRAMHPYPSQRLTCIDAVNLSKRLQLLECVWLTPIHSVKAAGWVRQL